MPEHATSLSPWPVTTTELSVLTDARIGASTGLAARPRADCITTATASVGPANRPFGRPRAMAGAITCRYVPGTVVSLARLATFPVCPGAQVAGRARAMALAASAANAPAGPASPTTLRVRDWPVPAGAEPLTGWRPPGRYCQGTFRGQRDQVRQARAFLGAFLHDWDRTDDAVLLIGELGANAVVHTRSGAPGGLFAVRAVLAGAWLRAEVEDQGSDWSGRLEDAECPHGLYLLRELSSRCGARRARHGWVTWFVLGPVPQTGRSGRYRLHSPWDGAP